ncbi:UvrD-helicase domain-containing protein [Streptomyces sp. A7024]|uniref:DNA 3'-5' helicase n=1 Tax=Streptomyces coryli TaxID=1128680 RepID=A0A6G4U8Q1_9ACTN|nr:ATP-dependent DNA helicase [Streptomyces coryli]NGN68382.1 UvrD-helicase domain-containing protein [Streptomyces coryli]
MPARLTHPDALKELLGIPFTPEQIACITAPLAPQVIVAGAGSGKTTVMAARVVWLVGTGQVAPGEVLGLTFTNKAAGELTDRVRSALRKAGVLDAEPEPGHVPGDEEADEPRIATYHAFAGQLLTDHGLRIGLEPGARLLADATRYQLAAKVLRTAPGPFPALTKSLAMLVSDLLALEAELSEHLVGLDELKRYDAELLRELERVKLTNDDLRKVPKAAQGRGELLRLVGAYREEKRRRDLIDFGDQIALSARLAEGHGAVGRKLREEFKVVLLDEYQDTSVAQRRMLAALFGAGHAVTAVGDPCQAIYGWRGASVANLDDFPRHFPHAEGRPATRYALSENRRSGGRLLSLANELAAPLRERHEGVEALRPAPGAEQDGFVRCALLPTHAEELDWLADHIAHLVRTGTPAGEIAVLCRTAGHFGEIQAALVRRDVPVEVVGLSGLLDLPEVADLVAMCEVLQDPGANAALVRLLTGPRWRIGARDLALLGRRARFMVYVSGARDAEDLDRRLAAAVEGVDPAEVASLADALDTFLDGSEPGDELPFSPEARVRFARLAAELRDLRRSLADPLMDVLHRILAVTGLEVELSASPHALAARRRETLGNFLDVAANFASLDGEATLLAFLGFLKTAAQYEKGLDNALPGDGSDTVKVLTAHKSKGLEWDVVVVPGLVASHFPNTDARESYASQAKVLPHVLRGDAATLPEVEAWSRQGVKDFKTALRDHQAVEELRLGYVTFTRPRKLLLGSGHWWGPTQKRPRGPSPFLEALREHCEGGTGASGEVEAWAEAPEEGAENPALRAAEEAAQWPMPLDPAATARRREAAAAVERHLAELERAREHPAGVEEVPLPEEPPLPEEVPLPEEPPLPEEEWLEEPPLPEEELAGEELPGKPPLPEHELAPAPEREPSPEHAPGPYEGQAPAPYEPPTAAPHDDESPPTPAPYDEPKRGDEALPLPAEHQRLLSSWDRDIEALEAELRAARRSVHDVPLPATLTASQLMHLATDPDGFAQELARPMPKAPAPSARRGSRFHAWVESRFDAQTLPLPGPEEDGLDDDAASEAEIADERDLAAMKAAFEQTPYANRTPYRVEAPFQLSLAGRVIRGRIDAVYQNADGSYEVIDWKTTRSRTADPLQLAIYRLAWAELMDVPLEAVRAAFVYVRTGEIAHPENLLGRSELEELLSPDDQHPHG